MKINVPLPFDRIDPPAEFTTMEAVAEVGAAAEAAGFHAGLVTDHPCPTGRWLDVAVKAVGGKVEDREAFLAALKKVELPDALRGPIKLDAHGNPVQNIYIRKVERKDAELQNTVVHTYPAVSQFWKWNPEEYLKQPAYTRDYPPCKHC